MRRERPAVVVVDLLMPDVDGFDVVERLRADPLVDDVPIVVLTSKDMTRATIIGSRARSATSRQKGAYGRAELVALVDAVARSAETAGEARHERRPLILIVEDNPRNLKLVRDILEHHGLPDAGGREREDGLALAREHRPDLDAHGRPAAGHGRRGGARPAARRPGHVALPCRRAHRVRHEGRSRAAPRGRIRRLPREADRHPRVPADIAAVLDGGDGG